MTEYIIALTGVITALIALLAILVENRRSKLALQADLLLRLDSVFYGLDMFSMRKLAAERFLTKKKENYEIDEILDFFSVIATLYERGALDKRMIYDMYHYYIVRYWHAGHSNVADARRFNRQAWQSLERVAKMMECEERKAGQQIVDSEEVIRFMNEEAYLRYAKDLLGEIL